jgi:hypothetical protein
MPLVSQVETTKKIAEIHKILDKDFVAAYICAQVVESLATPSVR